MHHHKSLWLSFTILMTMLFLPFMAHATSARELAELLCEYYDGLDCQFEEHASSYKFGSWHEWEGGTGKIRSQAAYCLIRDGDGAIASGTFGNEDDWYQFGAESRLHLVHAGKNSSDFYEADTQRLLDLVIFGHRLENIEVQNLATDFPTEKEKSKSGKCKKWLKSGKAKLCTQYLPGQPSFRTAYYLNLATESYSWKLGIDEVLKDLFEVELYGLEAEMGQNVPFAYSGTTELTAYENIMNDGVIPASAATDNLWTWGIHPDYGLESTGLKAEIPVASFTPGEAKLVLDFDMNGFHALREGNSASTSETPVINPEQEYPGSNSQNSNVATATYLAAGTELSLIAKVCLDFGWFGSWCGNFEIVKFDAMESHDPLNVVTYSTTGTPLSLMWADGTVSNGANAVASQINTCLSAPAIDQSPEEMSSPEDIAEFLSDVAQAFDEHYEVCDVFTPPSPQLSYDQPSFKLCDDDGRTYEAVNGNYEK